MVNFHTFPVVAVSTADGTVPYNIVLYMVGCPPGALGAPVLCLVED